MKREVHLPASGAGRPRAGRAGEQAEPKERVKIYLRKQPDARRRRQKAMLRQAAQAKREKSNALLQISHDMRTPLNAIMGLLQMAENCPGNPLRTKDCLEKIGLSAAMLLNLIDGVLEDIRLAHGGTKGRDIFDIDQMFHRLHVIFEVRAGEKGVFFHMSHSPEIGGWYKGDERKLERILINLLENAIKYTGTGERVWLTAAPAADAPNILCFTVRDTGIGMDAQLRARLFTPFVRGDNAVDNDPGGTGQGLAIAQRYATLLGGGIAVKSTPGKGSAFTVRIPLKKIKEPPAGKSRPTYGPKADAQRGRRLRVLLVEDNHINREVAQYQLTARGFMVETANDGAEALAKFENSRENRYDLILMDVLMPVMDGLEATRKIRALRRGDAQLPIIAMSAGTFPEDILKSEAAGMNAHLSKPLQMEALFKVLNKG